ncbi:MAG TPA: hypothetical protein VNP73_09295 [Actinomycetota bacterium]|nr:hypothetical protein [Actinomycetota bacterium]
MKRLIVLTLVAAIAAAFVAVPADAKKKMKKAPKPRVVEVPYQGGGIGIASPVYTIGACPMTSPGSLECIEIPPMPGEKYVKVEVKDAVPLTPAGFISQGDVDGDGIADGYGEFCGAHAEPVFLEGGMTPVRVSFYPGVCSNAGGASFPTTGTIVATFSTTP